MEAIQGSMAIHCQSMLTMTENMLFQLCGVVEQFRVGELTKGCSETGKTGTMFMFVTQFAKVLWYF